jgi:hypothetical protein
MKPRKVVPSATFSAKLLHVMQVWAGLLASGSAYSPRLPAPMGQWRDAVFVPGYSSATATELHRASLSPFVLSDLLTSFLLESNR